VEHNPDGDENFNPEVEDDEPKDFAWPGIAGRVSFDTGSLLLVAAAKWEEDHREYWDDVVAAEFEDSEDNWTVGGGVILRATDALRFEVAASIGEGMQEFDTWSSQCGLDGDGTECENDMKHWDVSGLAYFQFADTWAFEVGAAYTNLKHEEDELDNSDEIAVDEIFFVGGGVRWDPVDQLTFVLGGGYNHLKNKPEEEDDKADMDRWSVGLATYWRF
jgi:opacity protein-like surface antigen